MISPPGQYRTSLQGHRTFVPNSLPPPLILSPRTLQLVEEATHLLGQVEMCRTLLPNADLLIYSSLQREALASSTIEGTIATPDELVLFQVAEQSERGAVREVANYRFALEWGCEQLAQMPIVSRLILGLHARLLHEVRGASSVGRFKERQNYIGSHSSESIAEAVFVPCAPEVTPDLIADLERYINQSNDEARVVQCALAHYQFETIHPFADGNGRVGRLLIILHMMQLRLLSAPLIYPSVYFERTRADYYAALQQVRLASNWDQWIAYFAQGIVQQCRETITFTHMILALRQSLRAQVEDVRRRASFTDVLDAFFRDPVLTIRQISEQTGMSHNTVQSVLNDLEASSIVYELTQRQKGRAYVCRPVMDAVFGRLPPRAEHSAEEVYQQTLPLDTAEESSTA